MTDEEIRAEYRKLGERANDLFWAEVRALVRRIAGETPTSDPASIDLIRAAFGFPPLAKESRE